MLNPVYLIFAVLFVDASRADPPDVTQSDSQNLAAVTNQAGSDQSLRSSVGSAMQAVILFGDSDIKGAISNAYKAYGSFKNSENLDRAHKQGLLVKANMGTPGTINLDDKEQAFLTSATSYRRLDPSFLTKGDNAKLAEEFEKKTGLKRQEFLDMLSAAAENKLYVSDPKLAEKVDAQIDAFLAKIPKGDFHDKVENALSLVPSLSRHKLFVEAVQNMVQVAQKFGVGSGSDVKLASEPAAAPNVAAADRDPASAPVDPKNAKDAATDEALAHLTKSLTGDAMSRANDDADAHKLDGVIKAAIHDDPENESIFEKVSRRYRMLTPDLVPAKEKTGK